MSRKLKLALLFLFIAHIAYAGITMQPLKIAVTEESEKNTSWAENTVVYVTATDKYYKLSSGTFTEITASDYYWRGDGTLGTPSGAEATNIDGGFPDTDYGQISGIDGGGP